MNYPFLNALFLTSVFTILAYCKKCASNLLSIEPLMGLTAKFLEDLSDQQ